MKHDPTAPLGRLLDLALIAGPLCYLFLDTTYAVRGWWDGPTGALHVLAAVVYAATALRLVTMTSGRTQAVLAVIAVLGVVGNAGVGENTVHVALGGNDLFMEDAAPANLFKSMGFFFPLTFVVAAVALRDRLPRRVWVALAAGAVLFPVAHVANISWLAVADGLLMLAALAGVHAARDAATP
ncbi:hypothetical protein [Nocardioides currus]|uniref:Uncharacterized protein n=1 Tax=Nocardioides currus TaxID=2133958 RepID=A0A2R7Z2N1_9ACTN|nr:hypothetical protein [Nocardioides currus]PUA82878.1 hypothetical protein C7S10_04030 [Nocardioides currus]